MLSGTHYPSKTENLLTMIHPAPTFQENLLKLPGIENVHRIDLMDGDGNVVASIENQPGKRGSLAVYQYLQQQFDTLNAEAADYGLSLFAEHTAQARNNPEAHPNVDYLLAIAGGGAPLRILVLAAGR
jgi:hypothetical protein